jgi:hypothetical protein
MNAHHPASQRDFADDAIGVADGDAALPMVELKFPILLIHKMRDLKKPLGGRSQ